MGAQLMRSSRPPSCNGAYFKGVKGGKGREKGRKGDGNSPSRKVQFLLFFLSPLTFSKKVWEAVVQAAVTRDKMTADVAKAGEDQIHLVRMISKVGGDASHASSTVWLRL